MRRNEYKNLRKNRLQEKWFKIRNSVPVFHVFDWLQRAQSHRMSITQLETRDYFKKVTDVCRKIFELLVSLGVI